MNSVKQIEKLRSQTLLFSVSLRSLLQTFEILQDQLQTRCEQGQLPWFDPFSPGAVAYGCQWGRG